MVTYFPFNCSQLNNENLRVSYFIKTITLYKRIVTETDPFNVCSSCYGNSELPYGSPEPSFSTFCCHSPENMPANICTVVGRGSK